MKIIKYLSIVIISLVAVMLITIPGCKKSGVIDEKKPTERIEWKVGLQDIFNPDSNKISVYEVTSSQSETSTVQSSQFIATRETKKIDKDEVILEHINYLDGPVKGEQDIVLYKMSNQGLERSLAVPIGPIGKNLPEDSLKYVYSAKSVLLIPQTISKNEIWWESLEENKDLGTINGQNKYEVIGIETIKLKTGQAKNVLHIRVIFTPESKELDETTEDYYIQHGQGIIKHVTKVNKKETGKLELIKLISKDEAKKMLDAVSKPKS